MKYRIAHIIATVLDTVFNKKNVPGIPVLFYHAIGNTQSKLFVSTKQFEKQMRFLSEKGYRTILPEELPSANPQDKVFLITFDDGFTSVHDTAFPILQKYGFTATVFIATDYIGKKSSYARDEKNKQFDLMSVQQIETLHTHGWCIANHFASHTNLTELSREEVGKEYNTACTALGALPVATRTDIVAYPFNRHSEDVRTAVQSAGGSIGFNGGNRLYTLKEHMLAIPRIEVDNNFSKFQLYFSPSFHHINMKMRSHA